MHYIFIRSFIHECVSVVSGVCWGEWFLFTFLIHITIWKYFSTTFPIVKVISLIRYEIIYEYKSFEQTAPRWGEFHRLYITLLKRRNIFDMEMWERIVARTEMRAARLSLSDIWKVVF